MTKKLIFLNVLGSFFQSVWPLGVGFPHFRPENRAAGILCILGAGMVWNREILSKHEEIDFLDFYFYLCLKFLPVILVPDLFRKLRETPG